MSALILTILCIAELILFLLPGLALVALVSRRLSITASQLLMATIAASAATGYVAFWIYFFNKTAGQSFSWAVAGASTFAVFAAWKRGRVGGFLQPDFWFPLACAVCLSLFYLSLLYLFVNPLKAGVDVANVRFFPATRPGDNIIPFIFAERVYDRAPIRPFCCGDWLSSDRPPLQAGIFLLQRPLRVAGNTGLQYQVLGTLLECIWVCGVWVLVRVFGAPQWRAVQALGLLAFSGFLFYNSVYVWPKPLASAFVLFVFAIVGRAAIEKRALTMMELLLADGSFALALLAHPGSVFSAPAIAALMLLRWRFLAWKKALVAAAIVILAFVPWVLYQKFYDPPGNRLLKMHLAGVMEPDARSTLQAVRDAYAHASGARIAENKWANLETVFEILPRPWPGLRVAEREYLLYAIGVLAVGCLMAVRARSALPHAGAMAGAALLNLMVWSVVLFGPAQTKTAHGSYADIFLLSLAFIGIILTMPRVISAAVLGLQALNLVFVWARFRPASFVLPTRAVVSPAIQWPMLAIAVVTGGTLLWFFVERLMERESTPAVADALIEQQAE